MSEFINGFSASNIDSKNKSAIDESIDPKGSFQETLLSTMKNIATETDQTVSNEINEILEAISKPDLDLDNKDDFAGFVQNLDEVSKKFLI